MSTMLLTGAGLGSGSSPLLTGLVSWWKLDEASGARSDSHGSNPLTDNNTVTQGAGKIGGAAQFTAANSEHLSVADNVSLNPSAQMSFAAWLYSDTLDANRSPVSKWTYSTDGGWAIQTAGGAFDDLQVLIAASAADTGSNHGRTNGLGMTTATWFHVAVVFDGSQATNAGRLTVYVNGAAQALTFTGTIPATIRAPASAFMLGQFGGLGRFWNGRLDEAGLWSRALTPGEVAALYNGGAGRTHPFA